MSWSWKEEQKNDGKQKKLVPWLVGFNILTPCGMMMNTFKMLRA